MDILRQKIKNVNIVIRKKMEDPHVMNVDMKKMIKELKLIRLYVKSVTRY